MYSQEPTSTVELEPVPRKSVSLRSPLPSPWPPPTVFWLHGPAFSRLVKCNCIVCGLLMGGPWPRLPLMAPAQPGVCAARPRLCSECGADAAIPVCEVAAVNSFPLCVTCVFCR